MTARLLDGNAMAAQVRAELQPRIAAFAARTGRAPGLGIVLVGENPASEIYVRNKLRAASDVGIRADLERLPASASLADVLAVVEKLNASVVHDGLLVQDPLPEGLGSDAARIVFDAIDPRKDVDGFHPINAGRLLQKRPGLVPGTPLGVTVLLERSGIPIAGARAVVIGRSDIVGKPMALLLLHRDATVTICHSKTRDLPAVCREADVLVAAIGRPGFVTRDMVREGATVIDVGINRLTRDDAPERLWRHERIRTALEEKGKVLVGDVDYDDVLPVAGAITPVPGGVGPLTVAMLLDNTVKAYGLHS